MSRYPVSRNPAKVTFHYNEPLPGLPQPRTFHYNEPLPGLPQPRQSHISLQSAATRTEATPPKSHFTTISRYTDWSNPTIVTFHNNESLLGLKQPCQSHISQQSAATRTEATPPKSQFTTMSRYPESRNPTIVTFHNNESLLGPP